MKRGSKMRFDVSMTWRAKLLTREQIACQCVDDVASNVCQTLVEGMMTEGIECLRRIQQPLEAGGALRSGTRLNLNGRIEHAY